MKAVSVGDAIDHFGAVGVLRGDYETWDPADTKWRVDELLARGHHRKAEAVVRGALGMDAASRRQLLLRCLGSSGSLEEYRRLESEAAVERLELALNQAAAEPWGRAA